MGQGGAMAIEDGVCLAALFPNEPVTSSDIVNRLRLFEKCRRERVERIQAFTRRNGKDPNDETEPRPTGEQSDVHITKPFLLLIYCSG
jgi:salicylate hydroxylase